MLPDWVTAQGAVVITCGRHMVFPGNYLLGKPEEPEPVEDDDWMNPYDYDDCNPYEHDED